MEDSNLRGLVRRHNAAKETFEKAETTYYKLATELTSKLSKIEHLESWFGHLFSWEEVEFEDLKVGDIVKRCGPFDGKRGFTIGAVISKEQDYCYCFNFTCKQSTWGLYDTLIYRLLEDTSNNEANHE